MFVTFSLPEVKFKKQIVRYNGMLKHSIPFYSVYIFLFRIFWLRKSG
jgi:hypothetical protein